MRSLSNRVTFACNTLANIVREIIKMVSFCILSKQICENIYVYSDSSFKYPWSKLNARCFRLEMD